MAVKGTIASTDNGWSNDKKGLEWLAHFIRASKPTKGYKLFILNGHGNHATFAFRHITYFNRIILLYLPLYTTHKLQPCDVGMFSPLTTYYFNEIRDKAQFYNGQRMSKREYIEWMLLARDKANSRKNIVNLFKKCGIVPFKPNQILRQLKKTRLYTDIPIIWPSISDRPKTFTGQTALSIAVRDGTHIMRFFIEDVAVYHN
jgi:hypothetical protein